MYKILAGMLTILLANTAFALNSEYKNSLTKIDLSKSGETSYNINLYTSNEFSEPVKIIKKSDLNYYILLPETKNSIAKTPLNNSDIRSVDAQLFPYAGADVKNGYTKININTNKPINFTVNTKTISALKPQIQPVKEAKQEAKQEVKTVAQDAQVQKKNLVQENQKPKNDIIAKPKVNIIAKKPLNILPQAAAKIPLKEVEPKKEIKNEQTKQKASIKPQQKVQVPPVLKTDYSKEIKEEKNDVFSNEKANEEIKEELKQEDNLNNIDNVKEAEEETKREKAAPLVNKHISISSIKSKIKNGLLEYGLSFKEFILMALAGILSFVIMLLVLNKNKETDTRLKSKADFLDRKSNKPSTLVPKKQKADQYFVFDEGVHQTGFIAPITNEKKNYELSSYEPELHKATMTATGLKQPKQTDNEYDIIQNILKEDSYIEISDNDAAVVKEQATNPVLASKKEIKEIVKITDNTQEKDEPDILSKVEIAPQRGFMCVSYNNTINLIGYIFDDVFALYNFQQPKLENYNIKFRMSEKTPHGANYIVRIDKTKMLVGVTKSSMNLELAF